MPWRTGPSKWGSCLSKRKEGGYVKKKRGKVRHTGVKMCCSHSGLKAEAAPPQMQSGLCGQTENWSQVPGLK